MNNLPNDVLSHICKFFEPSDVCKLINKKYANLALYQYIYAIENDASAMALKKCKNVVSLKVRASQLNQLSAPMTKLKHLKIIDGALSDETIGRLISLNLDSIRIYKMHENYMPLFSTVKNVHAHIDCDKMYQYENAPFTSLSIHSEHGASLPRPLVLNPTKLTDLCLVNCNILSINFAGLQLTKLFVVRFGTMPDEFDISQVSHMPLRRLELRNFNITMCKLPIVELILDNCKVNLSSLNILDNLTTLSLMSCVITGEISNNVVHLEVNTDSTHETQLIRFNKLNLETLTTNLNLKDEDLLPFTNLKKLDVHRSLITGELLPLKLESLDLFGAPITTEGLKRIAQMPLRSLKLSSCGIKGQDLALISHLKLHTLGLQDNHIDVEYLALIKNMKLSTFIYTLKGLDCLRR